MPQQRRNKPTAAQRYRLFRCIICRLKSDPSPFVFLLRCYFLRRDTSSIPIGTTTFPNQLPEALLSANVGALGVLLGEPSHASLNQNRNVSRHTGAG